MVEALFQVYKTAQSLIDMRYHQGVHPRIGAVDVCPFIPLQGSKMEDCIELAHELGERVGNELQLSGYYYEAAALRKERENLAVCRAGEYEGILSRLDNSSWQPDFGPSVFNQRQGLTVIGARNFLIAYNVNLKTDSIKIARNIASLIRTSGSTYSNYRLPALKAIAWKINDFNRVQVSTNITDLRKNSLYTVWSAISTVAEKLATEPTGSELIGLIPQIALLTAGEGFAKELKEKINNKKQLIDLAIDRLGLNELSPFSKSERVLELKMEPETLCCNQL